MHVRSRPADGRRLPGRGLVSGRVVGPRLPLGRLGTAGPGGRPFPQRGDISWAEPYLGKCPVVYLIQPQPFISEVLAGQDRVQSAGNADQLRRSPAAPGPELGLGGLPRRADR